MQIACPNCNTTYQVADTSLGAAGRSVRCVRCRSVWFARNPTALSEIARDHRSDVAAFTASTTIANIIAEPPEPAPEPELAVDEIAYAESEPEAAAVPEESPATGEIAFEDAPPAEAEYQLPAEPVEITDSPALAPIEHDAAEALPETHPGEDIETIAARRIQRQARRKRKRSVMPGITTVILALVALNAALVGWRADMVRWMPQTAAIYAAIGFPVNLRGLVFSNVTTEKETHEGVQVLVVEGTITSVAPRVVEVPRLRFAVRNEGGNEIYTWTALPTRSLLPPGETLTFRSRLASPPRDGQEVLVRFFNRRDLVAGIQ